MGDIELRIKLQRHGTDRFDVVIINPATGDVKSRICGDDGNGYTADQVRTSTLRNWLSAAQIEQAIAQAAAEKH